ncbi:MAG: LysM peptidoglycan-binding domain-containing protein [Thermodesulfobacteriota bacterium]
MPRTFRILLILFVCLMCWTITAIPAPKAAHAYTVKAGDTPGGIAQKHGLTTKDLLKANPGLDPTKMRVGQEITIPGGKSGGADSASQSGKDEKAARKTDEKEQKPAAPASKKEEKPKTTEDKAAPTAGTYTVTKGDTPQSIAGKLGISVSDLLRANDNLDPRKLRVGQVLKTPGSAAAKTEKAEPGTESKKDGAPSAIRHKVKRGETLAAIAARYGVSADDIKRMNKSAASGKVKTGTVLTIPAGRTTPAPAAAAPTAEKQAAPPAEEKPATPAEEQAAAPPAAETAPPPADAETYFEKGNELGKQNQYQKAIEQFDRAIKLNPNRADYYASRGHAFYYMKLYTRAIEDYTRSIERNPSFALAYSMRGLSHTRDGHFDFALEDYNKAISLAPKEADYYKGRGYTYFHLKQYGPMCDDYQKACSLGDCELLETAKRENLCKASN